MDKAYIHLNKKTIGKFSIGKGFKTAFLLPIFFLCFSWLTSAQEIKATIDKDSIKIGEQISYRISVETDSSDLVVFPEGQTFTPLEMVEALKVDTSTVANKYKLVREYRLTQFDSGVYVIPGQKININSKVLQTDSLQVVVTNVEVDTTKQKLFPIKPSVEIPPQTPFPNWVWWVLGILILGGIGSALFRRKKKKEEAAKKLPPYEQAIFELQQLDQSHLLENREIKEYYSQLSDSVRRYLDEEVFDRAMESTTAELILFLEAERQSGKLNLQPQSIERLKEVLRRADLAKFANSKPDVITAKEDRTDTETIINDTKEAIPEPTEEELRQDRLYQEKLERKRKNRKIIWVSAIVLLLLGAFITYEVNTKGFSYMKDTYVGNKSKTLLEGEWIRSEYGNPPVSISTPKVLLRSEEVSTTNTKNLGKGKEAFSYGSLVGNYQILLSNTPIQEGSSFKLEEAVEGIYEYLENEGAKNIITKKEEFSTPNGAKGMKVFGTFSWTDPDSGENIKKQYVILDFAEQQAFQQITMIYKDNDSYADTITQRIMASVELITVQE